MYPAGVFSGRYDPTSNFDQLIVSGMGSDWVGKHSWQSFMACYDFSLGSPSEKWYRLVSGLSFAEQYPPESCLVGMQGCNKVAVLKCRNGQITTPLTLNHCLACTRFILPALTSGKLRLVGRAADTLFLYEFDQLVDVPQSSQPLPESFELSQNYPNPFNPTTTISYSLPRRSNVTIEIFNLLGQRIRTLVDESQSSGPHRVDWDGRDAAGKTVSSGVYLYRLKAGESVQSKKMILLK